MRTTHFWVVVDYPRRNRYNASTTATWLYSSFEWLAYPAGDGSLGI
ncbi:MAG: hypothetical protein ACRD5E_12020 [Nitrososphaeraceae archaeon]